MKLRYTSFVSFCPRLKAVGERKVKAVDELVMLDTVSAPLPVFKIVNLDIAPVSSDDPPRSMAVGVTTMLGKPNGKPTPLTATVNVLFDGSSVVNVIVFV